MDALMFRLAIAATALAMFSVLFDRWITRQELRGRHEGYVSLYVVIGVLVVLAGGAFVIADLGGEAWLAIIVIFCLFTAAGIPMIGGSINRYINAREREYNSIIAEIRALIHKGE